MGNIVRNVFVGSEKEHNDYGASSSDSEEEALVEMQSTGRRPSTNYRPEFAAKTLAQVTCLPTVQVLQPFTLH